MPESSPAAALAAEWWGARLQRGDRDGFEEALAALIDEKLVEWGEVWITCREAPDTILSQALKRAGIELRPGILSAQGVLPWAHLKVKRDKLYPEDQNGSMRAIRVP